MNTESQEPELLSYDERRLVVGRLSKTELLVCFQLAIAEAVANDSSPQAAFDRVLVQWATGCTAPA